MHSCSKTQFNLQPFSFFFMGDNSFDSSSFQYIWRFWCQTLKKQNKNRPNCKLHLWLFSFVFPETNLYICFDPNTLFVVLEVSGWRSILVVEWSRVWFGEQSHITLANLHAVCMRFVCTFVKKEPCRLNRWFDKHSVQKSKRIQVFQETENLKFNFFSFFFFKCLLTRTLVEISGGHRQTERMFKQEGD